MKKVVCFCRVSSVAQDLETQKKEVLKTIKYDGFKTNEIVIVEGKESAIKLKEQERQTLNELKQVIADNPTIKDIYFYAIDRLARKVSIVLSIVDQMTAQGINLHFLNPYVMQTMKDGKEDSMGKMFLTFLSIGAEMEMKMKAARFADKKKEMRNEGKLVVGSVLFGYYRDKNGYPKEKEVEADAVREIFSRYLKGETMRNITKDFMLRGIFDNQKLLAHNLVKLSHIINNPAYSGRQPKQNGSKEPKNIKYPALVSIAEQDEAMRISAANKRPKDTKNIYYAKGLVKTEVDGKLLTMSPIKGNVSYCLQYNGAQTNVNINVIDTIAWNTAKKFYNIYRDYNMFIEPQNINDKIEENKKLLERLTPVFDKFEERFRRLNRQYQLGRLKDEDYDLEWENINKEQEPFINDKVKIENTIKRLEKELDNLENKKNVEIDLDNTTDLERKELVNDMIKEIIVEKVGKYDYKIIPINSDKFRIGLATAVYFYNCSGGKQRLKEVVGMHERDISKDIIKRFAAAARNKKG